jgi:hypothetical protein
LFNHFWQNRGIITTRKTMPLAPPPPTPTPSPSSP